MLNPFVSVVMASYLGQYDGCASNREEKFIRAVKSFLTQTYKDCQLIIVSDGCDKTVELVKKHFNDDSRISLIAIDKQPIFSGNVRQQGLDAAKGDLICYLDIDDIMGKNHLKNIISQFDTDKYDFVYYNDILNDAGNRRAVTKAVSLTHGSVGTSSICHKKTNLISWSGCDGYGHDWIFVEKMIKKGMRHTKIYGAEYFICHVPGHFDS